MTILLNQVNSFIRFLSLLTLLTVDMLLLPVWTKTLPLYPCRQKEKSPKLRMQPRGLFSLSMN